MSQVMEVYDELMRFYSSGEFKAEALRARKEFSDFVGILDEDNPDDEIKFNQFADWYMHVRKHSTYGLTPVQLQFEKQLCQLSNEQKNQVQNLIESRLSLFEFKKLKKQDVHLKDLISGYKIVVTDSPIIHGFDPGVPFSARLVPAGDSVTFSMAFCFHPIEVIKYIKSEIKELKNKPEEDQASERVELILRLLRMRHRYDHFRKVPVNEIYTSESRLRF